MKPIGNKVIVEFDVEQKEVVQYGSLKLYIPNRGGISENEREARPTVGKVIAVPDNFEYVKEGDLLLFVHTILQNNAGWIYRDENKIGMVINADGSETIYGKLDENGEVIPLFDNYVCERINEQEVSSIIITPDAYKKVEPHKGKILKSPPKSDIPLNATCLYYKYSDYELVFNVNGQEKRNILVKRCDIVGWYDN